MQEYSVKNIQKQADLMELCHQIAQILLSQTEVELVLPQIARSLGQSLTASVCFITLGIGSSDPPPIASWTAEHWQGAIPGQLHLQLLQHPLSTMVFNSRGVVAIADLQEMEVSPLAEWALQGLPLRSILAVPLQGQQASGQGMILLGHAQPHRWTQQEQESLQWVAQMVGMGIFQGRLQQQLQTAQRSQNLINQLTVAIRSSWELDRIFDLAIGGINRVFQGQRGQILLLKYANPLLNKRSLKRLPAAKVTVAYEAIQETRITDGQASFSLLDCQLCQAAYRQVPEAMARSDWSESRDVSPTEVAGVFKLENYPALLMVPLDNQGTVLGFLVLQQSQIHFWQPEEIHLAQWVSAQISTAIIQHQTLRQVQALVEERTAQLQRSLEVQAMLYEKTRQQVDQLRQLNQLKDEFVDTISHELNTPLTKMKIAIQLLGQPNLPEDKRAKYIQLLEQQCNQEINLIEDLLTLQKLESHKQPLQLQKVDLKTVLQDLTTAFDEKWADKGINLEVDVPWRSLVIQTDPNSVNRIFVELLTNAGKYSAPDTTVYLQASQELRADQPQIVLQLRNYGAGIPESEIGYIFDKFRRGQGVTKQAIQGTGLGLALVKSLVQHLNGTIAVTSLPDDDSELFETCFTITLPIVLDGRASL